MSEVTNILLTVAVVDDEQIAAIEAIDLGDGQRFAPIGEAAGGQKMWEANTWAAAVNHSRPVPDILGQIRDALSTLDEPRQPVVIIHGEWDDPAAAPAIWMLDQLGVWRALP